MLETTLAVDKSVYWNNKCSLFFQKQKLSSEYKNSQVLSPSGLYPGKPCFTLPSCTNPQHLTKY